MARAGVQDAGFSGSRFTWCNNRGGRARIWKRLDRMLFNQGAATLSFNFQVHHLGRDPSDHAPLVLSAITRLDNKPRAFRFLNFWTSKPELLDVIRRGWEGSFPRLLLQRLASKLRQVKKHIQSWSREQFGNIFDAVQVAEERASLAEALFDDDPPEPKLLALQEARVVFRNALFVEEEFWKQKARAKWLQDRDRNTKYFHSIVAERRVRSIIHHIKDANGILLTEKSQIATEAVHFFESLFTAEPCLGSWDILGVIPKIISHDQNEDLVHVPSLEEVREVVFAMDGESAAGLDGFTGRFFSFAWDVVAKDVYEAVGNFFYGAEVPKSITATLVVLIPKGIRQGDPFSPPLFVIGAEVLSRLLNSLIRRRDFVPFKVPLGCPVVAHLAYAGDVIIFFSGMKKSLWLIMKALEDYEMVLGQKLPILLSGFPRYWRIFLQTFYGVLQILGHVFTGSNGEGGVGLRSLHHVFAAFSLKLWWRFRLQQSLWTEFMLLKYNPNLHPCYSELCPWQSATWKRMMDVQVVAERNIRWILGSGNSSFWHDNWLGPGPLCQEVETFQEQSVSEFVVQGCWDWQRLYDVLPTSWVHRVLEAAPPSSDQVWGFFEMSIGGFWEAIMIRHKVIAWWLKSGRTMYIRFLFRILPALICWNLWKTRNKFVFEGRVATVTQVCGRIVNKLHESFGTRFQGVSIPRSWSDLLDVVAGLRMSVNVLTVRWKCPLHAVVKLNSDGCSRGNPGRSGRGGLFQDSNGRFLLAFSCYFGEMTSLQAEMRALLHGVWLGVAWGLANLHLKSDSLVLIHIIQGRAKCPWVVQRELQELLQYRHHYREISHCFREANKPADRLSKVGADSGEPFVYDFFLTLPCMVR
ncbi:uncharacterized protein [Coffea arabica]|uniref:RNase H type-1 domain-containing protein n=1 Tax=Coffea arabica TaxID=13443 RepID=A0ABM4W0X4_COFAR